jgi:Cu(I)/Ag(I) efflux system protein CusF
MRSATVMVAAAVALGISAGAYAQQATFKGEITKIDELAGTITLKQDQTGTVGGGAPQATADYKVKDGLLFNAVKAGDKVEVTVDRVDGKLTITKLQKL